MKLGYVIGLRAENFMERRLQTQVFKMGLEKSIHHASVLIRHSISECADRLAKLAVCQNWQFKLVTGKAGKLALVVALAIVTRCQFRQCQVPVPATSLAIASASYQCQ
uniref:Uncharacterized protein n=1 Tax=Ditylenchus dipsaci TaxID=166011 RepID=A0A915DDS2_9BILA